jgi:RND family efflux transporter MFP subunit
MQTEKSDLSALRISADQKDPIAERRAPWKFIVPLGAVLLLALGAFFLRDALLPLPEVETVTATLSSPAESGSVLTASGYVVAQVKAAVASKATGRLVRLLVEEGDRVRRGEIIAYLESGDVVAALEQAKANLALARADSFDARRSLDRQRALFASGLTARADLDAAEARDRRVSATILAAAAAVTEAEVAVENTRIRAPFDGTVLTKDADVGEVVAPFGAATNSKGAVVTMADMSTLQVEADVSESNIMKVGVGQPCEITLDAYPESHYAGYVYKIVPTADRAKATVLTKVAFRHRDSRVLPEMSAKVNFLSEAISEHAPPKLMLDSSALVAEAGGWAVLRVKDGRIEKVPVKTGGAPGGRVEISEGLAPGDRVVRHPTTELSPGMQVRVKP